MHASLDHVIKHRVVIVLFLAGAADVLTGDPAAHGLALVAVAAALLLEERTIRRRGRPEATGERRPFRMILPLVVAGLAYATVVGAFARFSWPITIAVAAPGAAAVAFAWRTTPAVPDASRSAGPGSLPWLVVFLALAVWEVEGLLLQPSLTTSSWTHPTLSTLMDPVLASHAGRSITMAAWLLLGGWLLER